MKPDKLKSLSRLSRIVREEKRKGRKVVLANGCFDLIHAGHVRYLRHCQSAGDILIVALNSDASTRRLKGPGRPLLPQDERAEILCAFEFVDYVTIFAEDNVENILRTLKPDVHAKGSDYSVDTVPERAVVRAYGGEIFIAGGPKIRSTSEVIRNLAAARRQGGGRGGR